MKVYCITKENEDYSREASDWVKEFTATTGIDVEVLDPDTVDGELFVRARDIMMYPTVVAEEEVTGVMLGSWAGTPMPPFEEVSHFARTV